MLLINHPLDCPICDQGGECDLQDQAMAYGSTAAVSRKTSGRCATRIWVLGRDEHEPLHPCTRCIRFLTEIAGVESSARRGAAKR